MVFCWRQTPALVTDSASSGPSTASWAPCIMFVTRQVIVHYSNSNDGNPPPPHTVMTLPRIYRRLLLSSIILSSISLPLSLISLGQTSWYILPGVTVFTVVYDTTIFFVGRQQVRMNPEVYEDVLKFRPYTRVATLSCGILLAFWWAAGFATSLSWVPTAFAMAGPKEAELDSDGEFGALFIASSLCGVFFSAGVFGITVVMCRISYVDRKHAQADKFAKVGDARSARPEVLILEGSNRDAA